MSQQEETLQSFVEKLDQGHRFCIESEGKFWYLEKEEGRYMVNSSANMVRVPFTDASLAVFFLLSRIGEWIH